VPEQEGGVMKAARTLSRKGWRKNQEEGIVRRDGSDEENRGKKREHHMKRRKSRD